MDDVGRNSEIRRWFHDFQVVTWLRTPRNPLRFKAQKHCRRFFCRGNAHCLCSDHFTPRNHDKRQWNTCLNTMMQTYVNMMYTNHLKSRTSKKCCILYRHSPINLLIAVQKLSTHLVPLGCPDSPIMKKRGWSRLIVRSASIGPSWSSSLSGTSHAGSLVRCTGEENQKSSKNDTHYGLV